MKLLCTARTLRFSDPEMENDSPWRLSNTAYFHVRNIYTGFTKELNSDMHIISDTMRNIKRSTLHILT